MVMLLCLLYCCFVSLTVFFPKSCCRFRTYRRCEPHKVLSVPALCQPWVKTVSQKSKRYNFISYLLIVSLAIDNLNFLRMYFQPTHLHSFFSISGTYSACFPDSQCIIPSSTYLSHLHVGNSRVIHLSKV